MMWRRKYEYLNIGNRPDVDFWLLQESRSLAVESLRKILERERDDLYLIPDSVEQVSIKEVDGD